MKDSVKTEGTKTEEAVASVGNRDENLLLKGACFVWKAKSSVQIAQVLVLTQASKLAEKCYEKPTSLLLLFSFNLHS